MHAYRYIAVEGPIGVGKTSVARRLAERLGAASLLEAPQENAFLARFYAEPERYALATQLAFLFQRVDQAGTANESLDAGKLLVADYVLQKDALFAELTLAPDEFALYRRVWSAVPPAARPDLVIYLHASVPTLLQRIAERDRDYERALVADPAGAGYLARLAEAYSRFFHHYADAPVLAVNAERLDFVANDADLDLLLERIAAMRGPREHFAAAS